MRFRRKQQESGVVADAAAELSTEDTAAVPDEPVRTCPSCGHEASANERFCTSCGASLTGKADPTKPQSAADASPHAAAPRPGTSRRRRVLLWSLGGAVVLLLAAAAAAIVVLALAWRSERSGRRSAQQDRAAARAALADTEARLAATREELESAESLTKRQAAILAQTAVVLRQVDPLLTGVDRLQQVTGQIQNDRDAFSAAARSLVDDLVSIGNALLDAVGSGVDPSYLQDDIDSVNTSLDLVRKQAASLSNRDADYASASRVFGNRADTFTQAVRRLQQQLRALPQPTQ